MNSRPSPTKGVEDVAALAVALLNRDLAEGDAETCVEVPAQKQEQTGWWKRRRGDAS